MSVYVLVSYLQSPEEGTRHHGAVVAGREPPKLGDVN